MTLRPFSDESKPDEPVGDVLSQLFASPEVGGSSSGPVWGVGCRASVWTAVTEQSAVTALPWDGGRYLRTSVPPRAVQKRRLPQNPLAALQNLAARGGVPSSPQRLESGDEAKARSVENAERLSRLPSQRGRESPRRCPSGRSGTAGRAAERQRRSRVSGRGMSRQRLDCGDGAKRSHRFAVGREA